MEFLKYIIKKMLSPQSGLYQWLKNSYYRLGASWRPIHINNLDDLLRRYAEYRKNNVFFINIGANDGITEDPIAKYVKKYQWEGIMVEPVGYLFERLKKNYQGFPIAFENSAIAKQTGKQKFYRTAPSLALPDYYQRMGTLNKHFLLQHGAGTPNLKDYLIEEEINCLSFNDLKNKYQFSEAQLILIDTEGQDAEILQNIDLQALKTEIVIFEHIFLSFSSYKKILLLLKKQGFNVYRAGRDTMGVRNTLNLI
jgi:FkbM family methyltransferase